MAWPILTAKARQSGGGDDDAAAALVNVLERFERRVVAQHLDEVRNVPGYLFTVALHELWRIRKQAPPPTNELDAAALRDFEHFNEPPPDEERLAELHRRLLRLGTTCRRLMEMLMDGLDNTQIAQLMGYSSPKKAAKEKSECLQKLKKG